MHVELRFEEKNRILLIAAGLSFTVEPAVGTGEVVKQGEATREVAQ